MAGVTSSATCSKVLSSQVRHRPAFRSARSACRRTVCLAHDSTAVSGSATTRRALLAALGLAPAALMASEAFALLPDDDDEDMISKAKENRKQRLELELNTQKEFARTSGFKDASLAPVQRAVTQLARVGQQLSTGDVSGASGTLGGPWVDEVAKAAGAVRDFSSVDVALSAVKSAATKGDLADTKGKYVRAVSALQSWSKAAGITAQLRGL